MTPRDIITSFRDTVFDKVAPYYWSDSEALRYLNEAQRELCRQMYGINDGTTDTVTTYPVEAGQVWVDLHPSILKIRAAQRSDGRHVTPMNVEDFQNGSVAGGSDYGFQTSLRLDDTQGSVLYLVLGITEDKARLVRVPNAADTIQLTVERLPLNDVSTDDLDSDDVLEVRDEHHYYLTRWMAYMAYTKQDAETVNTNKAEDFKKMFLEYCHKARLEKERRQHKPRTVGYGGY